MKQTTQDQKATWARLPGGSWGVAAGPGLEWRTVQVFRRDGSAKKVHLGNIVDQKYYGTLYEVASEAKPAPRRSNTLGHSGYRGQCRAYGCTQQAKTVGYCADCYHNEFDM